MSVTERGHGAVWVDDETTLFYRYWLPGRAEKLRRRLFCVHGMGGHGGYYTAVGEYLSAHQTGVYALDLRGHGRSSGPRGDVRRLGELLSDLSAAIDQLIERASPGPREVFLLGESLGGPLALKFACEFPARLAGLILASPVLRPTVGLRLSELLRFLRDLALHGPARSVDVTLRQEVGSRDPALLRALREDPLFNRRVSLRFLLKAHRLVQESRALLGRRLSLPALILQGGQDRLTSPAGARELYSQIPHHSKELRIFPEAYHTIFHDPDTPKVLEVMRRWLEQQAGRRPAPLDSRAGSR